MREIRCRCCGVPVPAGLRSRVRVCIGCDGCDELHGDGLQAILTRAVADGKLSGSAALTRAIIDDAQLTGRAIYVEDPPGSGEASIRVNDPPARWFVVAARACCRNELPDFQSLTEAVLGARLPCDASQRNLDAIARELTEAYQFVDPSVMAVTVDSRRDELDPQHLIIQVQARTPTLGAVDMPGSEGVEIPADVLNRKRAEA